MKTLEKTNKAAASKQITAPEIIRITRAERRIVESFQVIHTKIPKVYSDALTQGQWTIVPSAIVHPSDIAVRVSQWEKPFRSPSGKRYPSRKADFLAIAEMPLDTLAQIPIEDESWEGIQTVCAELGIEPIQWVLGSVRYSAELRLGNR